MRGQAEYVLIILGKILYHAQLILYIIFNFINILLVNDKIEYIK